MNINDFNKKFHATLYISMSKEPKQLSSTLMNIKASKDSKILSMELETSVYEKNDFRDLTKKELDTIVFKGKKLSLKSFGIVVNHVSPSGNFTVGDIFAAVEETERQARPNSEWFGGIDLHHVFF